MDDKVTAVLDAYHELIREEQKTRRETPSAAGRDSGQDRWMRAVGPETGRLINILARSLKAPAFSNSAHPMAIPASGWRKPRGRPAAGWSP